MVTSGLATEGTAPDPADRFPAPSNSQQIAGGAICYVWNGTDADIFLMGAGEPTSHGTPLSEDVLSAVLAEASTLLPALHTFREHHRMWANHPGKFGATLVGQTTNMLRCRWTATAATGDAPGAPYLHYEADAWRVSLFGVRGTLDTAAWNDPDRIADLVDRLTDTDTWHVQAALQMPAEWATYVRGQERLARELEEKALRAAQEAALVAIAPTAPTVSTRKLMRALRAAADAGALPHAIRRGEVCHVDVTVPGQPHPVRIAECLIPVWGTATTAERRETRQAVRDAVSAAGYSAVLTVQGRYLIGPDEDVLREHVAALARLIRPAGSASKALTISK